MEPIRVLLWYWGRRGGGAHYTFNVARDLSARADVDLALTLSNGNALRGTFEALDRPTLWIDTFSGLVSAGLATARIPATRRRFRAFLRERRIEVVISSMAHVWTPLFLDIIRSEGARYVSVVHDATLHPGDALPLHDWAKRRELAAADAVVALSDHVRDQLTASWSVPGERIAVIPHGMIRLGVDPTPRRFPTDRPFRFLFFGRILAYKGFDILLRAFEILRTEGRSVELIAAGRGDVEPYRADLERLGDVRLVNRWIEEEEVARLVTESDALVLPYVEASQSGVVAVAHGAGVPVIVTPVGGLTEQVRHRRDGLIARAVSAEAVADAMRELLDPDLHAACARGAREAATRDEGIGEGFVRTARAVLGR